MLLLGKKTFQKRYLGAACSVVDDQDDRGLVFFNYDLGPALYRIRVQHGREQAAPCKVPMQRYYEL